MKTRRVGIILELIWPYRRHLDVFAGTQRFAAEAGNWECEIDEFHSDALRQPKSQLERYDGIIARASEPLAKLAARAKVPVVNVLYQTKVRDQLTGVFPDFAKVGTEAAKHLLERGFRQFGCLSMPREAAHREAVSAFHQQIANQGCHCQCAGGSRFYYRSHQSWVHFQEQLDDWIGTWKPPIALFVAFNDVTIRYVVHACRRRGLRVPEDVALIGATNEPMIGELPPPSLSSVEVSYEQIGYQAAQMLVQMMKRKSKNRGTS